MTQVNALPLDVETVLERLTEATESKVGQTYFEAIVNSLAYSLGIDYAVIGELDRENASINTIALHSKGEIIENITYDLLHAPCAEVIEQKTCFYHQGVQALYPKDIMLQDMDVESYLAAPLLSISGEAMGLLALMSCKPMSTADSVHHYCSVISHRITAELERRNALKLLQAEEKRFRDLANCSSDLIWEVDENLLYTYSSSTPEGILGYTEKEMIGKAPFDFMHQDEAFKFYEQLHPIITNRQSFRQIENYVVRKDGSTICVETSAVPIYDEDGEFRGYRGLDKDISAQKAYEEKIIYQANHDPLTGLANRYLMEIKFKQASQYSVDNGGKGALLFIDLDRFKQVNDSLGHFIGDKLIKQTAQRIKEVIRPGDTAARMGGDEFAVIMPSIVGEADVASVAHNIIDEIAKPFSIRGNELFVSASIGITVYPDDGKEIEKLLSNADSAMYKAKEAGRNKFHFFTAALHSETLKRYELINALHKAVMNEAFELHYQPIVNASSLEVIGCEALLRWHDDTFGNISPDIFIPLAEETGLIEQIGNWVIVEVCRVFSAATSELGDQFFVSVNVSSFQFQSGKLGKTIRNSLSNACLCPSKFVIEITESVMLNDDAQVLKQLEFLTGLGIRISIDDFGTGFSSLSYLNKYPIASLKIDREFTKNLGSGDKNRKLVKAIIAMSESLGVTTIAEGIEEESQSDFLQNNACNALQGYYFGKPMPFAELVRFVKQQHL